MKQTGSFFQRRILISDEIRKGFIKIDRAGMPVQSFKLWPDAGFFLSIFAKEVLFPFFFCGDKV